jgi:type I restriction enzyme S subunit
MQTGFEHIPTGEPWLPTAPKHWRLEKLKHVLIERNDRGNGSEPLLAATQTKGVVLKTEYDNRTVVAQKDLHLLKLVRVGDFVISLRSFQGGIEYARDQGIISPAYTVLYPRDSRHHGYLAALFKSRPFIGNLSLHVTGIRQGQNVDYVRLGRSRVPLPPPQEQAAIVAFIAALDRRVNRFIGAKRRLIELLNEQKQAIITQAVTRGLDPGAKMKPSGIDWLREVPEHWEVARLKTRLVLNDGGAWGGTFSTTGTVVLRSTEQTADGEWRLTDPAKRLLTPAERDKTLLRRDDLLLTKSSGSPAHIGKTTIVSAEIEAMRCGFSNFMQRLRLRRGISAALVWRVLNSNVAREQFRYLTNSTTGLGNLNATVINNLWIAWPPEDEQEPLAAGIVREIAPTERAIAGERRQVDLIREYRTRLVADVVTGTVDVREVVMVDVPDGAMLAADEDQESVGSAEEEVV